MKNIVKVLALVLGTMTLAACQQADTAKQQTDTPQQQVSLQDKIPPISVQLWSVKDYVKEDFEGTLKRIAKMGFKGVEFAGDFGPYTDDPAGLKQFLSSIGLQASGAHVQVGLLRGDKFQPTVDFLKAVGIELAIVPMDSRAWDDEKISELTAEFTELSGKLAEQGITFGYHNHYQEFADYQQQTYWDHIAQNTPDDMLLQMDVGWVNYAKKDPIDYVKRYPNRTLATHIKIRTEGSTGVNVIIGQDNFDWAELVKTDIEVGGTRWLVIEQEEYPEGMDPMMSIEASKQGLETLLKAL
ncbi:sugar phosphate isomerase/epimerase [Alteromonadaceae bacterium BrNp21-10]|nr:sugar phosphate isomerase/epimerase [Alteromonadaceae bacterium BrNp21-10]